MTVFSQLDIPAPAPTLAAVARRCVGACLRTLGRDELSPAAKRAVGRLAVLAGRHARGAVTVQVFADPCDETVRITVSDDSSDLPLGWTVVRAAADRARALVGVPGRCGVDVHADGGGKTVWFEPEVRDGGLGRV